MRDIRRVGRRCEKLHIRAVDMRTDGRLGKPAGEVKRLAARPLNRIIAVIGRLLDLQENACAGGTVTAEIQNARERGVTDAMIIGILTGFYREGIFYALHIGLNILNMLLSFAVFVLSTKPSEFVDELEKRGFSPVS